MRTFLPVLMLLAGCQSGLNVPRVQDQELTLQDEIVLSAPTPSAEICWARDVIPPVMGRGIGNIVVAPEQRADDGSVLQPAVIRRAETDIVLEPEKPYWFRTPCGADVDAAFISSVQRALEVRGVFEGPITGTLDAKTNDAIRAYQAAQGLDSAALSLKAAQQLGLANYDLDAGTP